MPTVKLVAEDDPTPRVQQVFRDIKETKKIDSVPNIWRAWRSTRSIWNSAGSRLKAIMRPGKVDLLDERNHRPGRVGDEQLPLLN